MISLKSFNQFINEAIDFEDRDTSAKEVSIFLGRMQPIHIGHEVIIKGMKNPIILLVKGKASSKDTKRNPFDAKYQTKLIKKLDSKAMVIEVKTGYIPEIANDLRKQGMELVSVYAGSDRLNDYKNQFSRLKLDADKEFKIDWNLTKRVASATDVRNAIIDDDEKAFKKLMPKSLWKEFKTMKQKLGVSNE
jgi:nicotinamide mononucleotide adenylyltransferase